MTTGLIPRGELRGRPLSPRELETLQAYVREGDMQRAADVIGISVQTVKNYLSSSYAKLGAISGIDAFHKLGWIRLPDEAGVAEILAESRRAAAIARLEELAETIGGWLDELRATDESARPAAAA